MEIREWQERLQATFPSDDAFSSVFSKVIAAEERHSVSIRQTFQGYSALTEGFQIFFAATLEAAEDRLRKMEPAQHPTNYGFMLLGLAGAFQTLRSASRSLLAGYPLPGFVLLRSLKERALLMGAVGNKYTTLSCLVGTRKASGDPSASTTDMDEARRRRMQEERRCLDLMLRSPVSGLPDLVRKELRIWERLFNLEAHGNLAFISMLGLQWMLGASPLPVIPKPEHLALSTFMNRAWEIGWMLLRILPLLQITPTAFGCDWTAKWHVLDESSEFAASGFAREGKSIGEAIIQLVNQKFAFSPETSCYQGDMG